ncbi:hypothetical protein THAOC_19247, partial [Thalassiosira oceanica]
RFARQAATHHEVDSRQESSHSSAFRWTLEAAGGSAGMHERLDIADAIMCGECGGGSDPGPLSSPSTGAGSGHGCSEIGRLHSGMRRVTAVPRFLPPPALPAERCFPGCGNNTRGGGAERETTCDQRSISSLGHPQPDKPPRSLRSSLLGLSGGFSGIKRGDIR